MRWIAVFIIVALISADVKAQIYSGRHRKSYFGIRGGYSLSGWSGLAYDFPGLVVKNVTGYHAGIFVSARVADNFTIEPAVYYSVKGWQMDGTLTAGTNTVSGTITNTISYLDMPLMLRVHLKGLNFGAGPQLIIPVQNDLKFDGTVNNASGSTTMTNVKGLQDFEVALAVSMGYEFDFGLLLNATYDLGLSNTALVYPYPEQFPYWTESKSRTLKLSIGFKVF